MVIGPNGEQLGVKPLQDALSLANAAGFDLVQMGGKPEEPVCKLMDYNKYKYEKNKKAKEAFKKQGLDPKNLSRTLEDSATITSPLIPWNTCGAYMSATLAVNSFAFLPFAFFNILVAVTPFWDVFKDFNSSLIILYCFSF